MSRKGSIAQIFSANSDKFLVLICEIVILVVVSCIPDHENPEPLETTLMKKTSAILLAILSASVCAQAQLLYEPFNYTVGSNLGGQGGWTNVNTGDEVTVASGNLSVSGLASSTGNSVTFGGLGVDPAFVFPTNTSTLWYSFAISVTDLGALDATGGYLAGFGQNITTFGATFWARVNGVGYDLGISKRTVAGDTVFTSSAFSLGSTVFVVGNYQYGAGAADDVSSLWINPNSTDFAAGSAPAPTLTTTATGTDLTGISRFFLRQDSATETPTVIVDELRIGSDWASVTPVPEPSTYALLGLGGLVVALRRRFARK